MPLKCVFLVYRADIEHSQWKHEMLATDFDGFKKTFSLRTVFVGALGNFYIHHSLLITEPQSRITSSKSSYLVHISPNSIIITVLCNTLNCQKCFRLYMFRTRLKTWVILQLEVEISDEQLRNFCTSNTFLYSPPPLWLCWCDLWRFLLWFSILLHSSRFLINHVEQNTEATHPLARMKSTVWIKQVLKWLK